MDPYKGKMGYDKDQGRYFYSIFYIYNLFLEHQEDNKVSQSEFHISKIFRNILLFHYLININSIILNLV